jgi:hypothetical protein
MRVTRLVGSVVAATALLVATASAQQGGGPVLKLAGFALNITGVGGGRSGDLEVAVERWSKDDERAKLKAAFVDGGAAGLQKALAAVAPRAGYVKTQRGGSLDLSYAHEVPGDDGGRRIILATGRLTAPSANPGADTYEFLVVEVRLGKDGKGEGRTATPQRLRYNKEKDALELDRYGVEPVWIKDLRVVSAK